MRAKLALTMPEQWRSLTGLDELAQAPPSPSHAKPVRSVRHVHASHHAVSPRASNTGTDYMTGAQQCSLCSSVLAKDFYRVNGQVACRSCAAAGRAGKAIESRTAFRQSLVLGVIAAGLGLAFCAGFTIFTHFYFGYVALPIGWMVGRLMAKGSFGVGGPRFQTAAAVLTYASISLSAVVVRIAELAPASQVDWGGHLGVFLIWGVAAPLLYMNNGLPGMIGFVLLLMGMRVAWKLTRAQRLAVTGPHPILC